MAFVHQFFPDEEACAAGTKFYVNRLRHATLSRLASKDVNVESVLYETSGFLCETSWSSSRSYIRLYNKSYGGAFCDQGPRTNAGLLKGLVESSSAPLAPPRWTTTRPCRGPCSKPSCGSGSCPLAYVSFCRRQIYGSFCAGCYRVHVTSKGICVDLRQC